MSTGASQNPTNEAAARQLTYWTVSVPVMPRPSWGVHTKWNVPAVLKRKTREYWPGSTSPESQLGPVNVCAMLSTLWALTASPTAMVRSMGEKR